MNCNGLNTGICLISWNSDSGYSLKTTHIILKQTHIEMIDTEFWVIGVQTLWPFEVAWWVWKRIIEGSFSFDKGLKYI